MILEAARRFGLDLAECFLIGDRWRDIEAGHAAGCRTVWIDYGYREKRPSVPADATVHALRDAVEWISKRGKDMGVRPVADLRVKIFADGADLSAMLDLYRKPWIAGFTTNPTLMRKAGVTDYCAFAREVLSAIPDRPISFEVFADEFTEMEAQAREIASWGENVYVNVPITNTKAEPALDLLCRLSHSGVKVNATAILAPGQARDAVAALAGGAPAYISIFAGRIADTGRDPVPIMASAVKAASQSPNIEVIWASPRELLTSSRRTRPDATSSRPPRTS
jgi:transaldolase